MGAKEHMNVNLWIFRELEFLKTPMWGKNVEVNSVAKWHRNTPDGVVGCYKGSCFLSYGVGWGVDGSGSGAVKRE